MKRDRHLKILQTGKRHAMAVASLVIAVVCLGLLAALALTSVSPSEATGFKRLAWYVAGGGSLGFLFLAVVFFASRRFVVIDGLVRRVRLPGQVRVPFDEVVLLVARVRRFAGDRHEAWGLALLTEEAAPELRADLENEVTAPMGSDALFGDATPRGVVVLAEGAPRSIALKKGAAASAILGVPCLAVDHLGSVSKVVSVSEEARPHSPQP